MMSFSSKCPTTFDCGHTCTNKRGTPCFKSCPQEDCWFKLANREYEAAQRIVNEELRKEKEERMRLAKIKLEEEQRRNPPPQPVIRCKLKPRVFDVRPHKKFHRERIGRAVVVMPTIQEKQLDNDESESGEKCSDNSQNS